MHENEHAPTKVCPCAPQVHGDGGRKRRTAELKFEAGTSNEPKEQSCYIYQATTGRIKTAWIQKTMPPNAWPNGQALEGLVCRCRAFKSTGRNWKDRNDLDPKTNAPPTPGQTARRWRGFSVVVAYSQVKATTRNIETPCIQKNIPPQRPTKRPGAGGACLSLSRMQMYMQLHQTLPLRVGPKKTTPPAPGLMAEHWTGFCFAEIAIVIYVNLMLFF